MNGIEWTKRTANWGGEHYEATNSNDLSINVFDQKDQATWIIEEKGDGNE